MTPSPKIERALRARLRDIMPAGMLANFPAGALDMIRLQSHVLIVTRDMTAKCIFFVVATPVTQASAALNAHKTMPATMLPPQS